MPPPDPPDPTPVPARTGVRKEAEGTTPPSFVAPEGMAARLLELGEQLRAEGVAVGTSELLDAFEALEHVDWTKATEFRETLSATIATVTTGPSITASYPPESP